MRENNILNHDWPALLSANPDVFLEEDSLHLSISGQNAGARTVAKAVRRISPQQLNALDWAGGQRIACYKYWGMEGIAHYGGNRAPVAGL